MFTMESMKKQSKIILLDNIRSMQNVGLFFSNYYKVHETWIFTQNI